MTRWNRVVACVLSGLGVLLIVGALVGLNALSTLIWGECAFLDFGADSCNSAQWLLQFGLFYAALLATPLLFCLFLLALLFFYLDVFRPRRRRRASS